MICPCPPEEDGPLGWAILGILLLLGVALGLKCINQGLPPNFFGISWPYILWPTGTLITWCISSSIYKRLMSGKTIKGI